MVSGAQSGNPPLFTFDVFDTTLCRLVHLPEHLHLIVGRRLLKQGISPYSDRQWMYLRTLAEQRCRALVDHREVTLEEIHALLARFAGLGPEAARLAMEAELQQELALIRPIGNTRRVLEAINAKGQLPTLISDTYFTSEFVQSLVRQAGIDVPCRIVASCERRKSKSEGTLYDEVAAELGVAPTSFRHLGDNAVADVKNARARGWNAEHFTASHPTTRERVLASSGQGEFLASAIAGSARAARLAQPENGKGGIVTAAASVAGPLFMAFTLWVLLDVLKRGGRAIHFLARDGQILAKICERLVRWLKVDVQPRYVYASRQAFLLPALPLESPGIVEEALALAYYDVVTLGEALIVLKYSPADIASVAAKLPFDMSRTSSSLSPGERRALVDTLLEPRLLVPLQERARQAREPALRYLEEAGLLEAEEAIICDFGWRGNTQLRMQKLLGSRAKLRAYYIGISESVLGSEHSHHAWTSGLPWNVGLLEVMAAADHTSVKGFVLQEGRPVCSPPLVENTVLIEWGALVQQEVSLRFVDNLLDAVDPELFSAQELQSALEAAALDAHHHFRVSPTPAEAHAYGTIPHHAGVTHEVSKDLAPPVTGADLLRHLVDRRARHTASSWYMGSLARSAEAALLPRMVHRSIEQYLRFRARLSSRLKHRDIIREGRQLLNEATAARRAAGTDRVSR